jgi:hypothetical protein
MVSVSACLRLACLLLMRAALSTATQSSASFRNIYVDSSGRAINASHHPLFFEAGSKGEEEQERKLRMQERRRRAREFLERNPPPPPSDRRQLEKLTDEQVRKLGWFSGGSSSTDLYSSGFLADPSQTYDKWAQAYRMLGAMIDCDHAKDEGSHDKNNNKNGDYQGGSQTCSRWMLWAAVRVLSCLLPYRASFLVS